MAGNFHVALCGVVDLARSVVLDILIVWVHNWSCPVLKIAVPGAAHAANMGFFLGAR